MSSATVVTSVDASSLSSAIISSAIASGASSSAASSIASSIVSSVSSALSAATQTTASSIASSSSVAATTPTSNPVTSTSIISVAPTGTTFVPPTSTSVVPTVVTTVERTITQIPATTGGTSGPFITTLTTTQPVVTTTPSVTSSATGSSSSASPSTLSASGSGNGSSGLSTGGKIAIAVIIPVVVVALGFLLGVFFWRRRKARKNAEEQRKNEMAEYGFNPNNDPTLAAVGAAAYHDDGSVVADDSGYRGWGTASSNARKPSTTLGSNSKGPIGLAISDNGSQPGGYGYQHSPSNGASDHYSGDPLMSGHPEGHDGIAALGGATAAGGIAAAAASRNNRNGQSDIHRGVSNASSSYSRGAPHSESSGDMPYPGPYVQEEAPYNIYNDASPTHGPYGDGSYGAGDAQPVIRDVQAKRNTRIERAPTFPQGGIAQNF